VGSAPLVPAPTTELCFSEEQVKSVDSTHSGDFSDESLLGHASGLGLVSIVDPVGPFASISTHVESATVIAGDRSSDDHDFAGLAIGELWIDDD